MITYDHAQGRWITPEERRMEAINNRTPLMNPQLWEYRLKLRIMRTHFLDPQFDSPSWMEEAKPAVEQDARVCLLRKDLYGKILENYPRIKEMEMRILHSIRNDSSIGMMARMPQEDPMHIFAPITEILNIAMQTRPKDSR